MVRALLPGSPPTHASQWPKPDRAPFEEGYPR